MTIEVYLSELEDSDSLLVVEKGRSVPPNSYDPLKDEQFMPNPKLILTIEGENWTDCMTKYHEQMGWEPYIPMENEDTNEKKDN